MSNDWDERVTIGPGSAWFWDPLSAQHVARYLWARPQVGPGLVLDIACGSGYGTALLAGPGRRVLGIDASTDAVVQAERNYGSAGVSFVRGDAAGLPVESSSVDFVVSFETIEHLTEPARFVAEIARVLRPSGILLLSTPDRDVYSRGRTDGRSNNPFHPSEMTRSELLALLQERLVIRGLLGQSRTPRPDRSVASGSGHRQGRVLRAMAKDAIRVATTPIFKNDSIAHRLFPYLRHRHVPTSSPSGEYAYIVVQATKKP